MARYERPSTRPVVRGRARLVTAVLIFLAGLPLAGCQTGSPATDAPAPASPSAEVSSSPSIEPSATPSTSAMPSAAADTTTILSPAPGATVAGPGVTVSGTGTAFEGTLLYLVVGADGSAVGQGYTEAGANGTVGPFSIDLTLEAGTYTVKVWEPGMGEDDSSAPPIHLAEVTFTVG